LRNLITQFQTGSFRPISFSFNSGGVKLLANSSGVGKTTWMLSFAQLCYLAQLGVPIPADEGTVLPLFDHFLTCVGNHEDATLQKSFFYKHVEQLMALLKSYETNKG
jgi:DNA mismatch repair ATPase MutS